MTVDIFYNEIVQCYHRFMTKDIGNQSVRVHIGNQLYDVKDVDTVIDMDTNKPNIVIHVKEK